MNRFFKSIAFLSLIIVASSCGGSRHSKKSHAVLPATWQREPIVIDGDSKDWPSPYPNYDAKAKVAYATSNDRNTLYITMETGDEMTQVKILKQGMTVSIDTGGGKAPDFNINYPLQNDIDPIEVSKKDFTQNKGDQTLYENKQLDQKINKGAQDANQFTLEGFIKCNGGFMVKQTTPCGIVVRMRIDEYKELVWEAAIPFKTIYGKETISAADAAKPISVCFAIKGFKKADSKNTSGDNSGSGMNNGMAGAGTNSGMGGRGGRGGGGKGGGRTQTQDPMQSLYESSKTWKYFGIAYEK